MPISSKLTVDEVDQLLRDAIAGKGPSLEGKNAHEAFDLILKDLRHAPAGAVIDMPSEVFAPDSLTSNRSSKQQVTDAGFSSTDDEGEVGMQ
jgi:hypothetical protein